MLQFQLKSDLQIKALSQLSLDVCKIMVGSVIIGFFVPSLGIPFWFFVVGIGAAIGTFYVGLSTLNLIK